MIDIHCHILPEMDDGSSGIEETRSLMRMQKEQGVRVIAATPHFYADQESPDAFFSRRSEKFALIQDLSFSMDLPVLLGAEVRYFTGISKVDLTKLRIQSTDLLLLEMPFIEWNDQIVDEVLSLSEEHQIILAHIERYLDYKKNRLYLQTLYDAGLLFQCNTSSLTNRKQKRTVLKMIGAHQISFLASDTHNTQFRPPLFTQAIEIITAKTSKEDALFLLNEGLQQFAAARDRIKEGKKRASKKFIREKIGKEREKDEKRRSGNSYRSWQAA